MVPITSVRFTTEKIFLTNHHIGGNPRLSRNFIPDQHPVVTLVYDDHSLTLGIKMHTCRKTESILPYIIEVTLIGPTLIHSFLPQGNVRVPTITERDFVPYQDSVIVLIRNNYMLVITRVHAHRKEKRTRTDESSSVSFVIIKVILPKNQARTLTIFRGNSTPPEDPMIAAVHHIKFSINHPNARGLRERIFFRLTDGEPIQTFVT